MDSFSWQLSRGECALAGVGDASAITAYWALVRRVLAGGYAPSAAPCCSLDASGAVMNRAYEGLLTEGTYGAGRCGAGSPAFLAKAMRFERRLEPVLARRR